MCVHENDVLTRTGVPNGRGVLEKSEFSQGSVRNLGNLMNNIGDGSKPEI